MCNFSLSKKILVLILLTLTVFVSCKKSSSYSYTKDIKIEILLSDDEGFDLFNPESYNYYNKDSIKIFYIINEMEVEINNPLLNPPRNFYVNYSQNRFRLQLFPNHDNSDEFPVTLIKFNNTVTDTIRCDFEREINSITCTKVWYNDDLVWEATSPNQPRLFEIIKLEIP